MRTNRLLWLSAVVLVALSAAAAVLYAQQTKSNPKLSAEDWIEIRQLYTRYGHAVDDMNSEADARAVANLWIEDGTWSSNADRPPARGRKAIGETYVDSYTRKFEGRQAPRRFYGDVEVLIEPSPEGASGRAYLALVRSTAKNGEPSVIDVMGEYHDVFVKTPDGWKFKARTFRSFTSGVPTPITR
jgi:hypothetical protein